MTKKKTVTKKKVAKKKVVKKAAIKKKAATKKPSTKKAPAKKAATTKKTTKKKSVAKKTTASQLNGKKAATTKKFKPPRVPYAALAAAPTPAYDPFDHEPLTEKQLRRVKTGLTAKDLRYFRQLLLERRAEIIGDVQGLEAARSGNAGEISHMPLHMADVGSDNYEQEFTLGLMEYERKIIIEIDDALQRIENKTYGVCHESAKPIARARLEAKPWAKYSIDVARERERRGL
ncbi:MAG: TraR/DksA C4-type zinc finger protein [Planctomycetota bacterium]